jgi:hypothetical protein
LRAKEIIGAAVDDSPILPPRRLLNCGKTRDPKAPTVPLGLWCADRSRPLAQGIYRIETDQGSSESDEER